VRADGVSGSNPGSSRRGYQIYHKYIREHEGLDGKTPAEACGITIKGKNKWKTLIENASSDL